MKADFIRKFILPPGPILSLMLAGLLLLSALLYYRAVKIQRFLEPALAVSEPRMRFSQSLNDLILQEFETVDIAGVRFRTQSILIDQSQLYVSAHHMKDTEPLILKKMGRVFLAALGNPNVREHISTILVEARYPLDPDPEMNKRLRTVTMERAGLVLNSLYAAEPALERQFWMYFAATAVPLDPKARDVDWIEFRIVPTERLHIEVLQRLEKYVR